MAVDFKSFFERLRIKNTANSTKQLDLTVDNSATPSTTTTIVAAQTANRTVTLPDTSGTLSTDGGAATLTNKTIDADQNTITNIDNNEIKANAAIDATKIANGTVSNTEFQYLDGVTSSIQTQIDNLATGVGTAINLGAGEGVFAQLVGSEFQFKSITGTGGINVTSDADEVNIDVTIPERANQNLSNLLSPTAINQDLIFDKVNAIVQTKDNLAGDSEDLTITTGAATGNRGDLTVSGRNLDLISDLGVIDVNASRITGMSDPTGGNEATTKSYVDSNLGGFTFDQTGKATDDVVTWDGAQFITAPIPALSPVIVQRGISGTEPIPPSGTMVLDLTLINTTAKAQTGGSLIIPEDGIYLLIYETDLSQTTTFRVAMSIYNVTTFTPLKQQLLEAVQTVGSNYGANYTITYITALTEDTALRPEVTSIWAGGPSAYNTRLTAIKIH